MTAVRVLVACLALLCLASSSAVASTDPVRFTVALSHGARLGAETAVSLELRIDPSLPAVTEFRLLTPAGLSLSESRLGAASCRSTKDQIERVMATAPHLRCPANSLLGTGRATATARLLVSEDEMFVGGAAIALHAGAPFADKPGLLITADTFNPVWMQLAYAGYLYVPPAPFGLGLAILVPPIPNPPFEAPVSLSTLQLTVGRASITYYRFSRGRRIAYHPGGIPLRGSCPSEGLRFRAILRFADSSRRAVDALVPCPPHRRRT